jgi:hypothetical protein
MIKSYQVFNRKQKILEEYHEFSMQVLDWSKEIKELNRGYELLHYHINYISTSSLEEALIKWKKIPKFRKHIEDTWGQDIPSLKKQIRDKKINSILE